MYLPPAAWTQLWQLTAVIIAVGAATTLCRRRPHLAYALWMVVLAKAVTPPIFTTNFSALAHVHQPAPPTWLTTAASDGEVAAATGGALSDSPISTPAAESVNANNFPSNPIQRIERPILPRWFALWLLGAGAVSSLAAVAILRRNRLLATARPADDALTQLAAQLARQLGVALPRVVVSDANFGPAVCGAWRPTLILPASVAEGSPADLRPILAHELIHLRRGDHIVVVLQFVVQAVWWFHPLVWWANRRVCRVRELCCDAETVTALNEPPRRYAHALIDVLDARLGVRPVFGFPGVRPVEVTAARIKEILAMSDRLLTRTPASYWLAALVAAALVLPGGAVAQTEKPEGETASAGGEQTKKPADEFAKQAKREQAEQKPAKPVLLLKYGDGKPDGVKSIAGAGEMIRFKLPKGQDNDLKALRIHSSRYGYPQPPDEDVEINILSADMKEPLHTELVPYKLFKRQQNQRWTLVPFEDPVDVPEEFWVVLNFNAEATKGVYVSYDTSSKGEHSRVGFNDEDAKPTKDKADWMVQAVLAK
jgi:beta-lactamase regulating signal transducer with metallopeptidase domain